MGFVGTDFYAALLAQLGADAQSGNLLIVCQMWQRYEGGSAAWNPWNTTEKMAGSSDYNGAGVQNFTSFSEGVQATFDTLTNDYYPDVVAAFRADLPITEWGLSGKIVSQISTWGTHGFAAYLQQIAEEPMDQATFDQLLSSSTVRPQLVAEDTVAHRNREIDLAFRLYLGRTCEFSEGDAYWSQLIDTAGMPQFLEALWGTPEAQNYRLTGVPDTADNITGPTVAVHQSDGSTSPYVRTGHAPAVAVLPAYRVPPTPPVITTAG